MIVQLEADISARLLADTTLTGLLGSSSAIYNQYVPDETAFPYVYYVVTSAASGDGFRLGKMDYMIDVHWCVEERSNANSYDPVVRGRAIEVRIFGDWLSQSAGTAPTYGINRWQPTLTGSGWSASVCVFKDARPEHTDGLMHWIHRYSLVVSKTGA